MYKICLYSNDIFDIKLKNIKYLFLNVRVDYVNCKNSTKVKTIASFKHYLM